MAIEIDGKKYKVVESLGYTSGYQAKVVKYPNDVGERVAVKRGGRWTWWSDNDHLGKTEHAWAHNPWA